MSDDAKSTATEQAAAVMLVLGAIGLVVGAVGLAGWWGLLLAVSALAVVLGLLEFQ